MASSKVFNVGIIGYGLSAKVFHIPFIATTPTLQLHSILQRKPKDGDSAPHDYPKLQHHTSLDAFLADPDLDLVVLSTPPETHFAFARQALTAAKHVLVEKPFVPTSSEAQQLAQLARDKERVLCVYQNRRWDSDFLTVKKLLQDGTLGRVVEFNTYFERYRPEKPTNWKGSLKMAQGGGPLYDLGTHILDQAYVLFGVPESVYAKFSSQRDGLLVGPRNPDLEPDSIWVQLSYGDGKVVRASATVHSAEMQQPRFCIRGTKGSYTKRGLDTQEPQLKGGMKTSDPQFGLEGPEWDGKLVLAREGGRLEEQAWPNVKPITYSSFYEGLAAALASGKEDDIPVPAKQAGDVLRILEAATESARSGREVDM